jgi:type II secretory pathway component PulJ
VSSLRYGRATLRLTDLLVALALAGLLVSGTYLLLDQGQRTYAIGAARVEVQQSTRLAVERLAAELRGAGFSRAATRFAAVAVAEPTRVTIQHDVDGDGLVGGSGERITYLLRGQTLRRDAGGGAQPVIDGVERLEFTYFDAHRRPTTQPDAVRTVVISLSARPTHAGSAAAAAVVATVTTEVRLRNR